MPKPKPPSFAPIDAVDSTDPLDTRRRPFAATTAQASAHEAAVRAAQEAALCPPCADIQRDWRRAPGHAELVQSANRKVLRGTRSVTVTRYRCDRCASLWDYENDPSNQRAGWSLARP